MQAFPEPVELLSRYRKMIKADPQAETVRVVAYVLDRLFRKHAAGTPPKVKEIECRIAQLETTFFGQNIDYSPESGCSAVRHQVRAVNRSRMRADLDAEVAASLRRSEERVRRRDPRFVTAAVERFWSRVGRHRRAYNAWVEHTPSQLKGDLRRAVERATYHEDADKPVDEYFRRMEHHFDLRKQWIEEYRGHLNQLGLPDVDWWGYTKSMRTWMRRWESVWSL
jgi:hypothetical protein